MGTRLLEKFDYMYADTVLATVECYTGGIAKVTNYTNNVIFQPFGVRSDSITMNDVDNLLEERCFPRTRANAKQLMQDIGCDYYSPREIIRHTHGVMTDDLFWIRYDYESNLTWDEVSVIRRL